MGAAAAGGGASDAIQGIADTHDQIIVGLIALLGTCVACLVWIIKNSRIIKVAADEATAANHAVNNVGPEDHRLYKMVEKISQKQDEFDRKWGNLPDDIDDAVGLVELLHGMDRRIAGIQGELREHVAWEMSAKYGSHGG